MAINTPVNMKEKMLFFNKFFRAPKEIGSVTPSSKYLARKMVGTVPWHEIQYAAELGAGTGAITKFIRIAKHASSKVIMFEKDQHLREQLIEQYTDFSCYPDACQLEIAMVNEGIPQLDCILSGLPFYNFPQAVRDKLLEQILIALRPGGWFIAFQYSKHMEKQLRHHFDIEKIHFVPFNFPPAFVYVCRKGAEITMPYEALINSNP